MSRLNGRSIISVDDLSVDDIEGIFRTADVIRESRQAFFGSASGRIAATLFYEPSTRTRLSFEAAMQRLGGGVISTPDMGASSAVKGESLADTARVVGSYADVLVVRHPWEGAARLVKEYAPVPVINAGDGSHEHPTQTLCDLYTLRAHHGTLRGLKVALCGDLLHGRTIHSLAFALARFGANVIFVPGDGNEMPDYVLRRLRRDYRAHIRRESLGFLSALYDDSPTGDGAATVDAIYITPTEPHQLAMSSVEGTAVEFQVGSEEALSIYVTRRQKERGSSPAEHSRYPTVTAKTLRARQFKNISILHPLPRVDELSPEVDEDPRSLYFEQAALGIPVRMALLWHVLGCDAETPGGEDSVGSGETSELAYSKPGFDCPNPTCVVNKEGQFARKGFEIVRDYGYKLRCLYCDHEADAAFAGNAESRFYYPSQLLDRFMPPVRLEHVRFFASTSDAEDAGFRPASEKWDSYQPREDGDGKRWIDLVSGGAR